ncbi:MAG: DUF2304 domain-containing protein [Provencibacterium sp.]|nr:DUF2304 domain-containing protein [Provencibacterium sp.]
MSPTFRIILILVSVLTAFWVARKIRKAQIKIEDTLFWLLFSLLLIFLSLFPSIAVFCSNLIGIASTVNFIFLTIIFVLMVKVFLLSIKVSQLESKLQAFAQAYAIRESVKTDSADSKPERV